MSYQMWRSRSGSRNLKLSNRKDVGESRLETGQCFECDRVRAGFGRANFIIWVNKMYIFL